MTKYLIDPFYYLLQILSFLIWALVHLNEFLNNVLLKIKDFLRTALAQISEKREVIFEPNSLNIVEGPLSQHGPSENPLSQHSLNESLPQIPTARYPIDRSLPRREYERELNRILCNYLGHRLTESREAVRIIEALLMIELFELYERGLIFYAGPTMVGITKGSLSLEYISQKVSLILVNESLTARQIVAELQTRENIVIRVQGLNRVLFTMRHLFVRSDDTHTWTNC